MLMIAFSSLSSINLRLPAGAGNTSLIHLIVYIRDTLDCVTEYNLTSVVVVPDIEGVNDLINTFQASSTNALNNNPFVQTLTSGNQNAVAQTITSLSQVFNQMNSENLDQAISSKLYRVVHQFQKRTFLFIGGVPAASISVSSLGSKSSPSISIPLNTSALIEYNQQLNNQAGIRDFLVPFTTNLIITTSNSIILQASAVAQLTQATNQLTRTTAVRKLLLLRIINIFYTWK